MPYIYGILTVPVSDPNPGCGSGGQGTGSVFICAGYNDVRFFGTCASNQYAFSYYATDESEYNRCINPYLDQSTMPDNFMPYQYMAGHATYNGQSLTPSIAIPPVNSNLPENIFAETTAENTIFGRDQANKKVFTAFADQTPVNFNGNTSTGLGGPGYLIVAYNTAWFSSWNDIAGFLNNSQWLNHDPQASGIIPNTRYSTFTYNQLQIETIEYQLANYLLLGANSGFLGFCNQQSTTCTGTGNPCSYYFDNSANNFCQDIATFLTTGSSSAPDKSSNSVIVNLAQNYNANLTTICSNSTNAECLCVQPTRSQLYTQIEGQLSPIIPGLIDGCWWAPCRTPSDYLVPTGKFVYPQENPCSTQICAQITNILQGGKIENPGNINQYLVCGTGGGNTPVAPQSNQHWGYYLAGGLAFLFLVGLVIFLLWRSKKDATD